MAKVQIKSETIATFGGIFHVMDVFERLGLGRLIDSSLGKRDASWNAFRYSEVIERYRLVVQRSPKKYHQRVRPLDDTMISPRWGVLMAMKGPNALQDTVFNH